MNRNDFEFGFVVIENMIYYVPELRDKGMTVGEILDFIDNLDVWPPLSVTVRLCEIFKVDVGTGFDDIYSRLHEMTK